MGGTATAGHGGYILKCDDDSYICVGRNRVARVQLPRSCTSHQENTSSTAVPSPPTALDYHRTPAACPDTTPIRTGLLHLLAELPPTPVALYGGQLVRAKAILTVGRWQNPEHARLYNRSEYLPYMQGGGYVLSSFAAEVRGWECRYQQKL